MFEKSPAWRKIVARTRESPVFYAGFAAACFAVPYGLGKVVMWATNPEVARERDKALQAQLKTKQTFHHEVKLRALKLFSYEFTDCIHICCVYK